jgi:hypothetical protein
VSRLLDFLGERKMASKWGRRVSRLLDSLGEESWPVSGVGECPDYLTLLMRKVGPQLIG